MAMSLNPQYDTIGKTFIQQYYAMFDDPNLRQNLLTFYNEEKSLMTFEGEQIFGRTKIMEKIQGLRFQKICHHCTVIDSQPMFDGGILISVLGQLKPGSIELCASETPSSLHLIFFLLGEYEHTDDDPAHTFLQVFVLKPMGETFYVEHDIFRLALHHTA